jgi:TatA/E family protein of Tat protein translocase
MAAICQLSGTVTSRSVVRSPAGRSISTRAVQIAPVRLSLSVLQSPLSAGVLQSSHQLRSRRVVCNGLFGLGLPELAVIAGVAALVFGPSKLPELGKGLGKTMKSFQSAAKEFESELKTAAADDSEAAKAPVEEKPKKE